MNKSILGEPRCDVALTNVIYWPAGCNPMLADDTALGEEAAALAGMGASAVQVNLEPHFRFDAHSDFDAIYAGLKRLVEACHATGLPVIEHHSSTCVSSRGAIGRTYRGVSFEKIICRNIRSNEPGIFKISHAGGLYECAWCCLNNPDWQALYQDHLRRYVLPAGFDGLQHDDIHFAPGWYYCGCEHCRRKFRAINGVALPSADYAGWENFDDPVWRDWILFRKQSAGDEFVRTKQTIGQDKLLYGCCSVGATSLIGQHDAGYSYEDFLRGANVIYREMIVHPRHRMVREKHYFPNWRILATDAKYFQGLSISTGCPVLNYSYPTTPGEMTLIAALSQSMGQGNLWPHAMGRFLPEGMPSPASNRDSAEFEADEAFGIALLYSDRTAAITSEDSQASIDCFRGWCEALLESGLPFFVLPVDLLDGAGLARLEGATLAIAPNLRCMSETAADALRSFVRNGGHLIATHETSACDQNGQRRTQFALADVFGINPFKTTQHYTLPFFVEKSFGEDHAGWIDRKLPHVLAQPNDPARSQILGWVERSNSCNLQPPSPAIVEHRFGKGTCLYFSGLVGTAAAETGVRPIDGGGFSASSIAQATSGSGAIWVDERDADCQQLMLHAIERLCPGKGPIAIHAKPEGYFTSIRKRGRSFFIHFINVNAGRIGNNERLQCEKGGFPEIPGKIEICVTGMKVTHASMQGATGQETFEIRVDEKDGQTLVTPIFAVTPHVCCLEICTTELD